jgi:hypothetical protein
VVGAKDCQDFKIIWPEVFPGEPRQDKNDGFVFTFRFQSTVNDLKPLYSLMSGA